jgi:cytoplasmic iron level regulating protein YaaA (DUF328/UPF0246 family)
MCRYAFQQKIQDPDELKGFDVDGYLFNREMSDENNYVFTKG